MLRKTVPSIMLFTLLFATFMMPLLPASAAQPSPVNAERVEATLRIAERAYQRLSHLINATQTNLTVMATIRNMGLEEALKANISLCEQAKALIGQAEQAFKDGNYDEAANCTLQAMHLLRRAFKGVNSILEQAGVERESPIQAQGLIEAAQRALKRIERLEQVLEGAQELLNQAKGLLNITEIRLLLRQGNVTDAAKRLAEANKLIGQAFKMVKAKAEERLAERAGRFVEKLEGICQEVAEKLGEAGLNASEVLEEIGLGNLSQFRHQVAEKLGAMKPDEIKQMIRGDFKLVGDRLRELRHALPLLRRLEKPRIAGILAEPDAWKGKAVLIKGRYCGWEAPEGIPGPNYTGPPVTRSDWIISDGTGWIYVTEGHPKPPIIFMPAVVGSRVLVVGSVETKTIEGATIPYIRAKIVLRLPSPEILKPLELLDVTVQKEATEGRVLLTITITNNANETVIFPNSIYGMTIMRRMAGGWLPLKEPISLPVLTKLQPGKSATVTITLYRLLGGAYKVISRGWLEESRRPVIGSAEFTLPPQRLFFPAHKSSTTF